MRTRCKKRGSTSRQTRVRVTTRVVVSVSTPRSRGRLEASRRLASVSPRSRGLAPRSRSRARTPRATFPDLLAAGLLD